MEVVVARDGREALAKLADEGPFDGVLMDCQMPVMDGYTATRELRSRPEWKDLPVIAMTASALAEDRERALASGMNAHITKPINVESMLRTMAEWIAGPGLPAAADAPTAIDRAAGLAYCIGNAELYERLLDGFRASEADFVAEVGRALAESRWADALRRSHDMKGLAGTIGARVLHTSVLALHAAIAAQQADTAQTELAALAAELERVFGEIDARPPQG